MMKQMKKTIVSFLAVLLLISAAGCSLRPKRSADEPFRLGFREGIINLNPYGALNAPESVAMSLLYDTLFEVDPDTGEIQPGLCVGQSTTVNKDGTYSWDLEIRSDVFWHDGTPLTAKDVMFTLKTTQLFSAMYGSPNCDFFYGGNMTVIDDTHLSFVIWDDYAYKEAYLADIPILPEHIWNVFPYMQYTEASQAADHPAAVQELSQLEANASTMIGSGPWRWGGYKDGICRIYRNESYWNGAPTLESVELVTGLSDPVEALVSNSVEAVWDLPGQTVAELSELGFLTGSGSPGNMVSLHFNLNEAATSPVKDPALRQSIDACLNREEILSLAFDGGVSNGGIMPPESLWQYTTSSQTADPAWLLDQNGYIDRNGDGVRETADGNLLELKLLCSSASPRWTAAAEVIQQQCLAMGLNIQVLPLGTEEMHRRMASGNYDMVLTGWNAGSDPAFLHGAFWWDEGKNVFCRINEKDQLIYPGWNDTGYNNREYDDLYEQLIKTSDSAQRQSIVSDLGAILQRDLPMLVIGWPTQNQACAAQWVEFKGEDAGLLFTPSSLQQILSTTVLD